MGESLGFGKGRKLSGGFVQHGNPLVECTKPDLISAWIAIDVIRFEPKPSASVSIFHVSFTVS